MQFCVALKPWKGVCHDQRPFCHSQQWHHLGGGQIGSTGGLTIQSAVGQGMPIGLTGGDGDDYIVGSGFFYTTPGALDDQDEDTILS